ADDKFTVWLNGTELGSQENWKTFRDFENVAGVLKPGRNVIAVRAENVKADVPKNPAGLVAGMLIELENGQKIELKSGTDWRVSREEARGWRAASFDDEPWGKAAVV